MGARSEVRVAGSGDAGAIGRLLHDFNLEYGDPTPGAEALAARLRTLLAGGDTAAIVGGPGPDGFAILRFRPSLWSEALDCYLAELYVVPERRCHGLGRAILEAAIDLARERGADNMEVGTSEDDVAARALYERLGFVNRERPPDGPVMYVYEREL